MGNPLKSIPMKYLFLTLSFIGLIGCAKETAEPCKLNQESDCVSTYIKWNPTTGDTISTSQSVFTGICDQSSYEQNTDAVSPHIEVIIDIDCPNCCD